MSAVVGVVVECMLDAVVASFVFSFVVCLLMVGGGWLVDVIRRRPHPGRRY